LYVRIVRGIGGKASRYCVLWASRLFVVSPYLSAIIEQDEAPIIITDYGGFFVSGVLFAMLFGYNLPTA
jgi:hypothetical protein